MPLATMTIIVVVGMVLFLVAAHAIQRAVKLSLDVVNHFAAPNKQFPIRTRIADRLADTLDFLLSQKDKPHLVIVCHSQGTVVTLDTLLGYQKHVYEGRWPLRSRKQVWQPGLWETRLQNEVASLTILTFGSPITHLYQHYFPSLYPKLGSMPALQGLEAEIAAGRVRWFNSYRVDDYIGTWIDPARENFPVNVPMPVGGHTSYWRQDVFERLFAEPGMEDVLVDTSGRA
jgi:hypothetical protein